MSASNRDRVEALLRRLHALDADGVEAASRRWYRGKASWADRELMAAHLIEAWRLPYLKKLPGEVARLARKPPDPGCPDRLDLDPYLDRPGLVLGVISYPPDEELPLRLQRAVEVVQTRWSQVDDLALDLAWSSLRLVLGADGGDRFRRDCWKNEGGIWVLRRRVIAQAEQAARLLVRDRSFSAAQAYRVTYLELAILEDPRPDPPWVPAKVRSRMLGHSRSDPVTPPECRGLSDNTFAGPGRASCTSAERPGR